MSSIINLCATAMGAGILSLPQAVSHCGWTVGIGLLLLFAVFADFSLRFLVHCSRLSGRGSFIGLAEHYLGDWGARSAKLALLLLLFGAVVLGMIVVGDLIPTALQDLSHSSNSTEIFIGRPFVTGAAVVAVFPLTLCKDISALKYTSAVALLFIFYVIAVLIARAAQHHALTDHPKIVAVDSERWGNLQAVLSLPLFVTAYACQFNIFKVDFELPPESKHHIDAIIHVSMGLVSCIYLLAAMLGLFLFGSDVKGDLLLEFHDDHLITAGQLLLGLTNMLKIPLVVMPLRLTAWEMLAALIDLKPEKDDKEGGGGADLEDSPDYSHDPRPSDASSCGCSRIRRITQRLGAYGAPVGTVLIVGTCFLCAVILKSLTKELDLLGATAGTVICLILPAAFFIAGHRAHGRYEGGALAEEKTTSVAAIHSHVNRAAAWTMLVLGAVIGVGSLILTIYYWDDTD